MTSPPGSRLLSDAQLQRLGASPADLVRDALSASPPDPDPDPDPATASYAKFERRFGASVASFAGWATQTASFLTARFEGYALDQERSWLVASRHGVSAADLEWDPDVERERFHRLAGAGDVEAAMVAYEDMERRYRRLHAAHHDWATTLWSDVYRLGGPDVLEECLRVLAESSLMRWMEEDVEKDPVQRIYNWAAVLKGNFVSLRVEEGDDRFTIVQDPCGTCTRQIRDGAYEGARGLAVVTEEHPITYGRGNLPIYRTHVAVMHRIMPIERLGVPWPSITCPEDCGVGPCRIDLMKDPRDPAVLTP